MMYRVSLILALILSLLLFGCASQQVTTLPDVAGQTWDYVVIGSSIGTWWMAHYGSLLESNLSVKIVYKSYYVANQKVSALLDRVMNDEFLREDIRNAEVITIGIGFADTSEAIYVYGASHANDRAKLQQELKTFRETYNSMLTEVVSLAPPTHTIIRIMDFYCPYVRRHTEDGVYGSTKRDWKSFNEVIVQAGRQHGIPVARVFQAFNGPSGDDDPDDRGYLSGDGTHPTLEGYKLIAEEFRKLGYQYLSQ